MVPRRASSPRPRLGRLVAMGRYYAALLVLAMLVPDCTGAEETAADVQPVAITLSAGSFAVIDDSDKPYSLGFELQGRPRTRWSLQPAIGATFGPDGIAFVYLGVLRDFPIGREWSVTASLGGGKFQNGDEIGVHHHLEFRSGIALSRLVAGRMRVGLAGYHVSNAGLERPNNGTEELSLFVSVPFSR